MPILRPPEDYALAGEINVSPFEFESFGQAGSGANQEHQQRTQMRRSLLAESVNFSWQ
jgi:hypothetical protein